MHLNNLCFILPSEVHDTEPPPPPPPPVHQHHQHSKPTKKDPSRRHSCGGGHIFDTLHHFFESRWARSSHHHTSPNRQPSSIYHDTVGVDLTEKVGGGVARIFSYAELYIGTKGFSEDEILGSGGFGKVYKAVLPSDGTEVAVKCLVGRGERFEKSFMAELVAVAHLRHRNLVRLRGWCVHDDDQLLLVYDYMPNLSLDRLLFKRAEYKGSMMILDWGRRVKLVNGLAAALFYLHEQLETQIIHRDVKTSNIMLDSHYNARLGDFGLARWLEHEYELEITSTPNKNQPFRLADTSTPNKNQPFRLADTTRAGGTIGYLSPESFHSVATAKSDVYSFGIVVMEIVSGRRAVDLTFPDDEIILVDWIRRLSDEGMLFEAGDNRLKVESYKLSEMEQMIHIGLLCTLHDPESRPNMKWVVEALSGSLSGKFPDLPSFKTHPLYISVSSSNSTTTTTTTNTTASGTTASFATNSSIFFTAQEESIISTIEHGKDDGGGDDDDDDDDGGDNDRDDKINGSKGVGSTRNSLSCCSTNPYSMVDTAREMTYNQIVYATDNFSEENRVAEVDFASSYRGFLDNRYILVKRLQMKTCPALRGRYATELLNLGRLRQRNLMQLRGWCTEQGEMLVIYDYAANHRLLTHHLFQNKVLQWKHRYNIIKALAYAIRYLHEEWDEQVIHRNITSSAVCIDPEMNPRLNSLALAEFLTRNENGGHIVINKNDSVRGIFGYISPEYMESGVATTMADVYSFGVVMLEVVTGEMAVDFRRPDVLLVQRIREFEGRRSQYEKLADCRMEGVYNHKELVRMAKLGMACTRSDPNVRPSIRKIVSILDGYDKSFMEEGLKKEGMEEWKRKNACLLSLNKRSQALGIH